MKKIFAALFLLAATAFAEGNNLVGDNVSVETTGTGYGKVAIVTNAAEPIEVYINKKYFGGWSSTGVFSCSSLNLDNDSWLSSTDAAGTGTLNLLKGNATDDTVLNCDSGDTIILSEGGTTAITIDPSTNGVTFATSAELGSDSVTDGLSVAHFTNGTQKAKIFWDGTGFNMSTIVGNNIYFGIAGVNEMLLGASALYPNVTGGNALGSSVYGWNGLYLSDGTDKWSLVPGTNTLIFGAGTADGADDQYLQITGGGGISGARGAYIELDGQDVGGVDTGGDAYIFAGRGSTGAGASTAWLGISSIDGSDFGKAVLAGGPSLAATRSGYVIAYGNESSGTGSIDITAGNVAGGAIYMSSGGYVNLTIPYETDADDVDLILGNASTTAPLFTIRANTADADDDAILYLESGGGNTTAGTRGGRIVLGGNESVAPGDVRLHAGLGDNGANKGDILMITGANLTRWSVQDTGDFSQDGTYGGNIVMAKAATGLIQGLAAIPADVTTYVGADFKQYEFGTAAAPYNLLHYGAANNASSAIMLVKSRKTDGSADTIVNDADKLGQIIFVGADGTNFRESAIIQAQVDGTPGGTDMPGRLVFLTAPDGSASPAEAMRIENTKNVRFSTPDAGYMTLGHTCVSKTTNGGGATETIASVIPAGAVVLGVTCRVDTVLAGAGLTTWSLGDGVDADLYGTTLALAAGTTVGTANYTASPRTQAWGTAAKDLTMTAAAGVFSSGVVTCCSTHQTFTGPAV